MKENLILKSYPTFSPEDIKAAISCGAELTKENRFERIFNANILLFNVNQQSLILFNKTKYQML